MTVEDLISELRKWPGHRNVVIALGSGGNRIDADLDEVTQASGPVIELKGYASLGGFDYEEE